MLSKIQAWQDRQALKLNPTWVIDGEPAQKWIRDNECIAKFGPLHLFADRLVVFPAAEYAYRNLGFSVRDPRGMSAEVDTDGAVTTRGTLTRALVVGGGWQDETDRRTAWLILSGPDGQELLPISPDKTMAARQFAVALNNAARTTD